MEKNEFDSLVQKYKEEMMKMAGKKISKDPVSHPIAMNLNATMPQNNVNESINQNEEVLPFEQGAPYSGEESEDVSSNETYSEFLKNNPESGTLKVQAFAAQQALPVGDVSVRVSKKFTDQEKIFFEGITDSTGIIDNIILPSPQKFLSEQPSDILPYAVYDFFASHPTFGTENSNEIQIFQGIKSIQPVRIVPQARNIV